jgi:2,4-dienoyl-CoA reductase-like NADH-dependent reductase (Old Yellow Enzyme family)
MKLFTPFRVREIELRNRIVVSPMCDYSAKQGHPQPWHMVHLGSRAVGGAGLVMTERALWKSAGGSRSKTRVFTMTRTLNPGGRLRSL